MDPDPHWDLDPQFKKMLDPDKADKYRILLQISPD